MTNLSKGIIVTGANGWIGREVCQSLQRQGSYVVACDLEEQPGAWDYFLKINLCDASITSNSEDHGFFSYAEEWSLVHCAGYAHRPIETPEEVQRFYAINHLGTQKVVDWCKVHAVKRIVYISSIAFYDWSLNTKTAITEEAPVLGTTAYADSKLKGELCVRDSGLDYRVVRLATVFGDGDRANFAKLARALESGKFIIPGVGDARKSVISVTCAAECIGQLALMREVPYRLINLGLQQAPSLGEICQSFSDVCGFKTAPRAPFWFLRLAAFFGDLIAIIKPSFPLTSVNVSKLTRSSCVDCSCAAEMFPGLAELSFKDELKKNADYYRDL